MLLENVAWPGSGRSWQRGRIELAGERIRALHPESDIVVECLPGDDLRRVVVPGLIDLHSDAVEKAIEPRPGTHMPHEMAVKALDRRLVANGITTVFHAISFAGPELGLRNPKTAYEIVQTILRLRDSLAARHHIHIRYEISDPDSVDLIIQLLQSGAVSILSFMNHTPGQGQFPEEYDYIKYLILTYSKTEREARHLLKRKREALAGAEDRVRSLAEAGIRHGAVLACHDLEEPERVARWSALGITLAEFPLNLETARTCRMEGLQTLFGAPNIVRGESSGSGVRAMDAIQADAADAICSDYLPETLLPALQIIAEESLLSFAEALTLLTRMPADLCRMQELGRIQPGALADLLVLTPQAGSLTLNETWVRGQRRLLTGPTTP